MPLELLRIGAMLPQRAMGTVFHDTVCLSWNAYFPQAVAGLQA